MENKQVITVEQGKKEVTVLSYGTAPYVVDGRGRIIPDGFQVETFVYGLWFIASTKVEGDKAMYEFALKDDTTKSSGWRKSPTGALDTVQALIGNTRHHKGINGQLMIGVTYPSLQVGIRKALGLSPSPSQVPSAPSPVKKRDTRKRMRNEDVTEDVKRMEEALECGTEFDEYQPITELINAIDYAGSFLFEDEDL